MATFKRQFGSNTPVSPADDTAPKESTKSDSSSTQDSKSTSVNKDVWAEAEKQVLQNGVAGISDEGRKTMIQERYDQMIENDKNLKKWAGEGGILGDV